MTPENSIFSVFADVNYLCTERKYIIDKSKSGMEIS